jgi:hypothetical protein
LVKGIWFGIRSVFSGRSIGFATSNEITVEIAFTPTTGGYHAQQIACPAGGLLEEKFENRLLEPTIQFFPTLSRCKRWFENLSTAEGQRGALVRKIHCPTGRRLALFGG